jgi:purine-binding chemotaxis protein CheW
MIKESNSYLTFELGKEKFAIKVDCVHEVVEFGQVTKIPQAAAYMVGIVNLRGKVLPLIDTKIKLGLPPAIPTPKTRIMVLDIPGLEGTIQIGAIVDLAREVVEIRDGDIHLPGELEKENINFPVSGIVNNHGDITMIMDIRKVFSLVEVPQEVQN